MYQALLRFSSILIILFLMSCSKNWDSTTAYADPDSCNNFGPYIRKPNIYLYPTGKINLDIQLIFPNGGVIIESVPKYEDGWKIEVLPSGLINNQFDYLFYEARIPDLLQKEYGWIVNGPYLSIFFMNNLDSLLFSKKETNDFLEYWIPLLDKTKTYVIYPQFNKDLEEIVQIELSVAPDNLIRVVYLIEESNEKITIDTPQIPSFIREGFTVLEWGVIN
jgi:hypothetical protein